MINLIFAHPYPRRSIAQRALLAAVRDAPGVHVRSLYDLYPDFSIDVEAERKAAGGSRLLIWQAPLYWYSVPALLKLWFEQVLGEGWAYGADGTALRGKDCLWVVSTGATAAAYTAAGKHGHVFAQFEPAIAQTARFCGMNWLPPVIVHGSHKLSAEELAQRAAAYRTRLDGYVTGNAGPQTSGQDVNSSLVVPAAGR